MNPDIVVDVGNTRVKWGWCVESGVKEVVSLLPNHWNGYERQLSEWRTGDSLRWAVCGVQPRVCDGLVHWLRERGHDVWVIDTWKQLSLAVSVYHPERVGLDRLLNAVAALGSYERYRSPAIVVDAGTAVTVDWVEPDCGFRGGAILPGFRLMSQALHDHTALLPLVSFSKRPLSMPGRSTEQAIEAGVFHAVVGGINSLIRELSAAWTQPPHIFLTGGDAPLLHPAVHGRTEIWPEMTLEGIRLAALAQPS